MAEWAPIKPPILSPSAISTFNQCRLKFKLEKIDKRYGPGTMESLRGSFVHEILEYLFKKPAEQRTLDAAKVISRERWNIKWKNKMTGVVVGDDDQNQFKWTSWYLVENYFNMEDPTQIEPVGLETWVDGPIINNIRVRGIIDRLIEEDGKLVIQDYKTGKTPTSERWSEGRIFPLMIYTDLTESDKKQDVVRTDLLYLESGKVISYEPTTENRQAMYTKVIETSEALNEACVSGDFYPTKTKLCDWCSFQDECPAWN